MSKRTEKAFSTAMHPSPVYRFRTAGRGARTWSREEIRRLRELAEAGVPADIIATTLRRTVSAVNNKAGLHGISVRLMRPAEKEGESRPEQWTN